MILKETWPKQTEPEKLWWSAYSRAKKNNIPFDITPADIFIPSHCPYLKKKMIKGTMMAPSLDRIIPELGYVRGNIEVISRKANAMKSNASVEELLEFAYTILERN